MPTTQQRNGVIRGIAHSLGLTQPTDEDLSILCFPRGKAFHRAAEDWLRRFDRQRRARTRLARLREYTGSRSSDLDPDDVAPSRVYFLSSVGLIKIGRATNLRARVRGIQLQSAAPVTLLCDIEGGALEERALHKRFAALREHGEWFRNEEPLAAFIARLQRDPRTEIDS